MNAGLTPVVRMVQTAAGARRAREKGVEVKKASVQRRPVGPGRLTAEAAAQLEDRLLDAAEALFVRDGYERTSLERVARTAGASTKTVYGRYASKAALLGAVASRMIDRALADMTTTAAPPSGPVDPRTILLKLGRQSVELAHRPEVAGVNRLVGTAHQVPELRQLFLTLSERAAANLATILERWRDQGLLELKHDPQLTSTILIEMVGSYPRMRGMIGAPMTRKETDALVTTVVDMFLAACHYRGDR
jgi:TetR/AcrR family transcriptional regulator, mexJK operon transcriptional repressor